MPGRTFSTNWRTTKPSRRSSPWDWRVTPAGFWLTSLCPTTGILCCRPLTATELKAVRKSVNRGSPFGDDNCVQAIARHLNLQSPLRPRGRPKKSPDTFASAGYHEAHEEHEGFSEKSIRCVIVVPARGTSESRSHNRSCDSAARRIPSSCPSCPSWLLQISPVVNALIGERHG